MRTIPRTLLAAALLLASSSSLRAQTAVDPSGHWEGSIQPGPNMVMKIEVDLTKNGSGALAGTFGQPEQGVKGLPLSTVAVSGGAVRFVLKAGPEAATFQGTLSADGKSISGEAAQGAMSMPFSLTRTGDARVAPAPKSAAISKELEGTWNGTLSAEGREERLVLKLANQADGTATGTIVDLDGSNVEIPVAITQKASAVTIDVTSVGGSFSAILNAGEMAGTWTQGPVALPVTFRRAGK
ncbi:MAG TPA: hypothetical protein VKI43_15900 [Vicinamibacterales bacterium]|nr:hypothetical protein [Vicinamibacterales bacterium]